MKAERIDLKSKKFIELQIKKEKLERQISQLERNDILLVLVMKISEMEIKNIF